MIVWVLLAWLPVHAALASQSIQDQLPDPINPDWFADIERPDLVEAVEAGEMKVANAAWWGFDPNNATRALQAAISSNAEILIVPNMGVAWNVDPIKLQGNQTILFEAGTIVRATRGKAYAHLGSNLIRAHHVQNVRLWGPGATLAMNYFDYISGEHRHLIYLAGCRNVTIEGLRLMGSGGDGVYVGRGIQRLDGPTHCENITLRNLIIHQHRRQGVSVISVKNFLMENCTVFDIKGTAPQGGIDFEPNHPDEFIQNCVVRNCTFTDLGGSVFAFVPKYDETSPPFSITFDNVFVSSPDRSVFVAGPFRDGVRGELTLRNSVIEGRAGSLLLVMGWSAEGPKLNVENTRLVVLDSEHPLGNPPVGFRSNANVQSEYLGNVTFKNLIIETPHDLPVVGFDKFHKVGGVKNVSGDITVISPHEPTVALGDAVDVNLDITHINRSPVTAGKGHATVIALDQTQQMVAGQSVPKPHVIWDFDQGHLDFINMRGRHGSSQLYLTAIGEGEIDPPSYGRLAGVNSQQRRDGNPLDNMLNGSTMSGPGGVARSRNNEVDYFSGLKQFTIAGWLYTPEDVQSWGDGARIFSWYDSGDDKGIELMGQSNRLVLKVNGQVAISEGGRAGYYVNGRWTYFAVTFDGTQDKPVVKFYRGRPQGQGEFKTELINTVTLDEPVPEGAGPTKTWFSLANEPGRQRAFAGRMDNIAFWSDRGNTNGVMTLDELEAYRMLSVGLVPDQE